MTTLMYFKYVAEYKVNVCEYYQMKSSSLLELISMLEINNILFIR